MKFCNCFDPQSARDRDCASRSTLQPLPANDPQLHALEEMDIVDCDGEPSPRDPTSRLFSPADPTTAWASLSGLRVPQVLVPLPRITCLPPSRDNRPSPSTSTSMGRPQ